MSLKDRPASQDAIKNLCDAFGYTYEKRRCTDNGMVYRHYRLFKNAKLVTVIGRQQPIETWTTLIGVYESGATSWSTTGRWFNVSVSDEPAS